jgi:hypothetical protein
MTINVVQLIAPQQLTNATATYYTSTNVVTRIDKFTVTNPTGGAVTCTLYLVPSAGSANDGTTITSAKSIQAGETWNCPDMVGQILKAGGTIQAKASANTSLTISAGGVTQT